MRMRVSGLDEAIEETEEALVRAERLDVLDDVAGMLRTHMDERFETATEPNGTAWPPKADGTRADLGSIRETVFAERTGTTTIAYGARHAAASYQQDGTDTLPARPFAPTEDNAPALVESIGAAIERYLAGE